MGNERILTDDQIDNLLDGVLRSSGSRLHHYTIPSHLEAMRDAVRTIEQAVLQSPEVQNLIEAAQEFSDLYGWLWDTTDDGGFLSPEGVKRYDAAHDKLQAALCILQGNPLPYDPSLDDDFGEAE